MEAVTATIVSSGTAGVIAVDRNIKYLRYVLVETAETVDAGDTFDVDISIYSGTTFLGVDGYKHTTDNSVVVAEDHTTAVSGTTMTLTVPAGTDDDKRLAKIYFV